MDPSDVLLYYHSRFQIEFLYRDGKQHTGLNDSQARSENKLHFQFKASLTSINIAKQFIGSYSTKNQNHKLMVYQN